MRRVCRPGGRIIFLNHFLSPNPLRLARRAADFSVHDPHRLQGRPRSAGVSGAGGAQADLDREGEHPAHLVARDVRQGLSRPLWLAVICGVLPAALRRSRPHGPRERRSHLLLRRRRHSRERRLAEPDQQSRRQHGLPRKAPAQVLDRRRADRGSGCCRTTSSASASGTRSSAASPSSMSSRSAGGSPVRSAASSPCSCCSSTARCSSSTDCATTTWKRRCCCPIAAASTTSWRGRRRTPATRGARHVVAVMLYFVLGFMTKFVAALFLPVVLGAGGAAHRRDAARLVGEWRLWRRALALVPRARRAVVRLPARSSRAQGSGASCSVRTSYDAVHGLARSEPHAAVGLLLRDDVPRDVPHTERSGSRCSAASCSCSSGSSASRRSKSCSSCVVRAPDRADLDRHLQASPLRVSVPAAAGARRRIRSRLAGWPRRDPVDAPMRRCIERWSPGVRGASRRPRASGAGRRPRLLAVGDARARPGATSRRRRAGLPQLARRVRLVFALRARHAGGARR